MSNQKRIFLQNEGNNWFQRNKETLENAENFIDMDLLSRYIKDGMNVLEIGCSNGQKLNYLREKIGGNKINLFGVDPSEESISSGKVKFKDIQLIVGTSDQLEYVDNFFDIVVLGFCMYLFDRSLLFKSIAEIDNRL